MKKLFVKIFTFVPFFIVFLFAVYIVSSTSSLPGGIRLYSVMSGSMQPAISVGSIIIGKQEKNYKAKDIITFTLAGSKSKVTHRITKIEKKGGGIAYWVKGDANNANDPVPVQNREVFGKVIFTIPYLGYFFRFINTLPGLIIVIALGTIIIYTELLEIKNEIVRLFQERKKKI